MSNTTLIEQHQVALDGLKLNTAKLNTFAKSKWTWINPKENRVTVDKLIRELVSFYKALDRAQLGTCSNEIDAARAAIYKALIASAENPEKRGILIVQEMYSRGKGFDTILKELNYHETPTYVMPAAQAVSAPLPVDEPKPKGPSLWESCKSFLSNLWNAIKSLSSIFIPTKPDQTFPVIVPKPAPPSPPSTTTESEGVSPIQYQRDLEADRLEHERLVKAAQADEWQILSAQKQAREPGVRVSQQYIRNK